MRITIDTMCDTIYTLNQPLSAIKTVMADEAVQVTIDEDDSSFQAVPDPEATVCTDEALLDKLVKEAAAVRPSPVAGWCVTCFSDSIVEDAYEASNTLSRARGIYILSCYCIFVSLTSVIPFVTQPEYIHFGISIGVVGALGLIVTSTMKNKIQCRRFVRLIASGLCFVVSLLGCWNNYCTYYGSEDVLPSVWLLTGAHIIAAPGELP